MAVCKQSAEEFIQDVFAPVIAVLCSPDAECLCQKNNLSFVEMLQPFCRLNNEVCIRDLSLLSNNLRNPRIIIRDMKSQPYSPTLDKKMLSDAVTNTKWDTGLKSSLTIGSYSLKFCTTTPWFEAYRNIFLQNFYPSEHEFTNRFIGCIYVVSSKHEDPLTLLSNMVQEQLLHQQNTMTKWFNNNICKYFVLLHDVSDGDIQRAETIYQGIKNSYGASQCHLLQINSQGTQIEEQEETGNLPDPWNQFLIPSPDLSTSMELIKSSSDPPDLTPSQKLLSKTNSGSTESITNSSENVFLHPLSTNNFESLSPPDVKTTVEEDWATAARNQRLANSQSKLHGQYLSSSDRERIRVLVHDFFSQCLVPYAERQIRLLNDQVMNRKGIHRSIFSATKKWFGSNKPGLQAIGNPANSVVYSQDAPELQVRKLGDIAFMFQLYEVAYQAYHTAKKDFGNDQAWIHYAGALEMAALSVFLQGTASSRQFPYHYSDNAITTYLTSCKLPQFATRSTLLSTETLKSKGMYSEAAQLFIRLTSEDSDLRSALLLEQASLCFLHSKPRMVRKFAFHAILSGHRYSKAGQRKHALRCYQQAWEVYHDRDWVLASDHINFTIGRQSLNLKHLEEACEAFKSLLVSRKQQSEVQQGTYLKEYLFVLKQLLTEDDNKTIPELPIPSIKLQDIKVLLAQPEPEQNDKSILVDSGSFADDEGKNGCWAKLEEMLHSQASGLKMGTIKPHLNLLSGKTLNTYKPYIVVGETVTTELTLCNPLQVPLMLNNVYLIWTFHPDIGKEENKRSFCNENSGDQTPSLEEMVETQLIDELKLESLIETKIYLYLRPKKTGQLQTTSLAFTLLSQPSSALISNPDPLEEKPRSHAALAVRGKLNLNIKGPRLNQTLQEKNSHVYGPDNRLNWTVVEPMPKLQAKFADFPTTLLCGEVKLVNVQFTNTGLCPLRRLLAASPSPELFVFGVCGGDDLDSYSHLGYAIRSSSSTNGNPLCCSSPVMVEWKKVTRVTELFGIDGGPIILAPGASISLPFWIRAPNEVGEHQLDIQFYYEMQEPRKELKYRLCHHTFNISASPSISLTASARRSYLPGGEPGEEDTNNLILSLEAQNLIKEGNPEVSIIQINAASRNWWIKSIDGTSLNGPVHLKPAETMEMNFHALPFTAKHTVASQEVLIFSQIPLERTTVDSSLSPCSDFCFRSLMDLPLFGSVDNFPSNVEVVDTSLKDLESSSSVKLTLTALWKATVQRHGKFFVVMGQHHFFIEQLLPYVPSSTPLMQINSIPLLTGESYKTMLAQRLVKCVLLHHSQIRHNFKIKRLATVPVKLALSNCSCTSVRLELDLCNSENLDMLVESISRYKWIGATRHMLTLAPHASKVISLTASFSYPGTFNLATLRIMAGLSQDSNKELVLQEQLSPSLLVISEQV